MNKMVASLEAVIRNKVTEVVRSVLQTDASLEAVIRNKVTEVVRSVLQTDAQVTAGIVAQLEQLIRDRFAGMVRGVTHEDPALAARFRPYRAQDAAYAIDWRAPRSPDAPDGLPMPPQTLWAGYCHTDAEYLELGRVHHAGMMELLATAGFSQQPGQRVLELGCAAGRILRHFASAARDSEYWGVDISAEHIAWCQRHLSPPFRFSTSTTYPHLPFEDRSFDLIYASSVFTHIGDLEDMWLLELRRILKPGALAFITIHDNRTIEILRNATNESWLFGTGIHRELVDYANRHDLPPSGFGSFVTSRQPGNTQVFHDNDYVRAVWGRYFDIVSINPEATAYQAAVIVRKPA